MPIDYANYPPDWKQIRVRILNRANHVCEQCGAPNGVRIVRHKGRPEEWVTRLEWHTLPVFEKGQYKRSIKVVLTIAHLNHNTKDNRDENLMALCQRCHLVHDAKFHAWHAARTRARRKIEAKEQAGQLSLL